MEQKLLELLGLVEKCEAIEGCMTPEIYQLMDLVNQLLEVLETLI